MKILVTGGGGFLGKALAMALVEEGHDVVSLSRGTYPALEALGIKAMSGDIADADAVFAAAEGCDAVFHVAAKAGVAGVYQDYYNANVVGTKNVIDACLKHGITKLIYTSSPSVVFHGTDQEGLDESEKYPERFLSPYPKTKAMAERLVLEANSRELATVSLRPHLIWGPGDNHLVPRIVSRAKAGKLRIVGDGTNLVDTVYIDNAVDAHVLALEKLAINSKVAGKAYFITNGEPVPMAEMINRILEAARIPPVTKSVSANAAYVVGAGMEFLYSIFAKNKEPLMTRFVARELSTAHWFDISAARNDLGYDPRVSIDEGLGKLKKWFQVQDA